MSLSFEVSCKTVIKWNYFIVSDYTKTMLQFIQLWQISNQWLFCDYPWNYTSIEHIITWRAVTACNCWLRVGTCYRTNQNPWASQVIICFWQRFGGLCGWMDLISMTRKTNSKRKKQTLYKSICVSYSLWIFLSTSLKPLKYIPLVELR